MFKTESKTLYSVEIEEKGSQSFGSKEEKDGDEEEKLFTLAWIISQGNKMKTKGEEILFIILFLAVFITFMIVGIDKEYIRPLKSLIVMLAFKCFFSIGLLKENHVDGIKAFLFKTIFPFLTLHAMSNISKQELGSLVAFSGYGLGCNIFVFIFGSAILFGIYKFGALTKERAFTVAFGMGGVACGATVYPFVTALDGGVKPAVYFPKIVVIDFANKVWTLILIYIIIIAIMARSKLCKNFKDTINAFFIPLFTAPIVIGFFVGIILLLCDNPIEESSLKASEHFMLGMKELAEVTTMAFIGLKLEIPNLQNIQVFIPMMLRRFISIFFISAIQQIKNYDLKTFQTLLMFANGAISIWPYVHFSKIIEAGDSRVDLDFYLQMVAYDYSVAAILNLIVSLPGIEHNYWSGYIMAFCFGILTVFFCLISNYYSSRKKDTCLSISLETEEDMSTAQVLDQSKTIDHKSFTEDL